MTKLESSFDLKKFCLEISKIKAWHENDNLKYIIRRMMIQRNDQLINLFYMFWKIYSPFMGHYNIFLFRLMSCSSVLLSEATIFVVALINDH